MSKSFVILLRPFSMNNSYPNFTWIPSCLTQSALQDDPVFVFPPLSPKRLIAERREKSSYIEAMLPWLIVDSSPGFSCTHPFANAKLLGVLT
jgi:hypothetical protein